MTRKFQFGGLLIAEGGASVTFDDSRLRPEIRVRCLDASGRSIQDIALTPKPHDPAEVGFYFKTPFRTRRLEISIDKPGDGDLTLRSLRLQNDSAGRLRRPLCNIPAYMKPIGKGERVVDETVAMESVGGAPATGRLLYLPDRIESVRDALTGRSFKAGSDYRVEGRTLTVLPGSAMPFVKDSDYPTGKYPWFEANGKHVLVTYDHSDPWDGPVAVSQSDRLPRLAAKLQAHRPVRIVAYGDSITHGLDVSSYLDQPPYMPTWADLFADALRRSTDDRRISLLNTALPGATSEWGVENADLSVGELHPDLVLIAFGMNDFWSLTPPQFGHNIEAIIRKVRVKAPEAEFVLIASMPFDPAYTDEEPYCKNLSGYSDVLRNLSGPGVAFLDMYDIAWALYAAKKPKDLMENPMHPNDFLARWYAQSLAALVLPDADEPPTVRR